MQKVRYTVVLEWDHEEKVYVASVPALTIATQGKTRTEAMRMVREAIALTVEGLKANGLPVPTGDGDKIRRVEVAV
ncbi:MAG: type II toxin-antitoxin system HicB family antitoxin [SAR202 cluster bacterium]|nr:type II toxin-antitoxin system HicB family antitoxin [SAR202 cluster bacterium]